MTCLEAQSNIMAFIDKKLPDERVNDFVKHIKSCSNCSEELEIYYTLIVGIRQLDNNEELSKDFSKDLNNELVKLSNKVKKVKRFKVSSFSVICISLVVAFYFIYSTCLNKVYKAEQFRIKVNQGNEYFSQYFGDYIDLCNKDIIEDYYYVLDDNINKEKEEKLEFYNKILEYNALSIYEENDNE